MPNRTITPGTRRSWRLYEWIIALIIGGGIAWIAIANEDDPAPEYIDVSYHDMGYTCPTGYDGPEYVGDNVVRCTRHDLGGK